MSDTTIENEPRFAGIKEVLGMAAPIALGTTSFAAMLLVDTYFVGQLGTAQLGAVGTAGVWTYTAFVFFIGIASCVSTFVSQSVGRGRPEDGARYTWQAIYLAIATSVYALALAPVTPAIFGWMGHGADVVHYEVVYFHVRLYGMPFLVANVVFQCFFQAINRPGIPTAIAIAAVFLNVFLDYAMIFGHYGFPAMGVAGAAWATNVSLIVQVVVVMAIFLYKPLHEAYGTRDLRFDSHKLNELLRIGVPAGLFSMLEILTWAVFISLIVGRFGEIALAANTVAINLMHMSFMPAVAVNHAIAPIVGQWIGRGDPLRAKARAVTATWLTIAYMLFMGILFAALGPQIIRLFNDAPEVVRLGHALLICAAVFQGFDGINIVISGALRGAGDTKFMTIVTAVLAYGLFLPAATILAIVFNGGAIGAWIGATIYIIALSGILGWRWHAERWREIRIFRDPSEPDTPTAIPGVEAEPAVTSD